METEIENDEPAGPTTAKGQTLQPTTPEQRTQPTPSGNAVFLMKAKGQSFEEFTEFCVRRFREAGLIKD